MLAACTAVGIHIVGGFQWGFFFPPVYGFLKLGCEQPQGCKLAVLKFVDERVHRL